MGAVDVSETDQNMIVIKYGMPMEAIMPQAKPMGRERPRKVSKRTKKRQDDSKFKFDLKFLSNGKTGKI